MSRSGALALVVVDACADVVRPLIMSERRETLARLLGHAASLAKQRGVAVVLANRVAADMSDGAADGAWVPADTRAFARVCGSRLRVAHKRQRGGGQRGRGPERSISVHTGDDADAAPAIVTITSEGLVDSSELEAAELAAAPRCAACAALDSDEDMEDV